jgi:hypothetical protein
VAGIDDRSYLVPETAMGIDQIGKKGPPLPPPEGQTGQIGGGQRAEIARPFEVPSAPTTLSAPQAAALEPPRTALERLRAGEVDVSGYLDLKVDEATAHLAGLPAPELEAIRTALRERMASDPTLFELVRTAAGTAPELPGE